jgi:GntR family histidine utilization transcriptional repressor
MKAQKLVNKLKLSDESRRTQKTFQPLYLKLKQYILHCIESGQWAEQTRIPAEKRLAEDFGVSRMTANRAINELTNEGRLFRIQGDGTYVSPPPPKGNYFKIKGISDEIAARGGIHHCRVIQLTKTSAPPEVLFAMDLPAGKTVYYSLLLHFNNETPIQLAERYVNPEVAPDYIDQDFTKITPSEYLTKVAPLEEVEQIVAAVMPNEQTQNLLQISANQPCLVIYRRTWSGGRIGCKSTMYHPGVSFQLGGRFKTASFNVSPIF